MQKSSSSKIRRVAISLEMDFGFKRHLETYAGCLTYANEAGWECSVHPAVDRELNAHPKDPPFDGVIARATPALAEAAKKTKVPVVNLWMNSPVSNLPCVFPDFLTSGKMAAEHLLARGFRQLAYLGYQREIDSRLQGKGFREIALREGVPCTTLRFSRTAIEGRARGWNDFVARLSSWIDTWQLPIGVLCVDDLECRYLIDICNSKGLHVSQDVAIVGSKNELAICESPFPSLTSIDMGSAQVGYRAAAMLDRLMSGEDPPTQPELVPPPELVPRQSTDAFAVDDPLVARALRFIAENGHQRIEVKEVVTAVATNRRSLERKFSDSLGRTIAGEITRLRLERAKRRMVETDAPMKDVAEDAGFRNADHFYKVFTRVEGVPPTKYREQRQKLFPPQSE